MARWPTVVEGAGDRPSAIGYAVDPGVRLARPAEIVAWGGVDGVPWQIQAFVTEPDADGRWWEHGPVGPELEFSLGKDGRFGGGGAGTLLNEGTHLTASVQFFGLRPDVVTWLGVVSEKVDRLDVCTDEGDERTIGLKLGPPGFPRLFWFFPPRGATGQLVATSADGRELQREALIDFESSPANSGTSVNPFGYPAGRPPPGWQDDRTEYGPGEGPRRAEDFHLHEATFPLFVVPLDLWNGYAGLSGSGSSWRVLEHVGFGYFDEPGGHRRGFQVTNERPGRPRDERPARPEDVGIWWSEPLADNHLVNFASRFVSADVRRELLHLGLLETGPLQLVSLVELDVSGHRVVVAARAYRRFPALRSMCFDLPDVRVTLHGWDLSFDEMERYLRSLQRLELGTDLFRSMATAQEWTARRFDELHRDRSAEGPGAR